MKIFYRQNHNNEYNNLLRSFGIGNCYFKWIYQSNQDGSSTKKRHSHTGYEFHMVLGGRQCYETCDGDFSVESGYFLAIPKGRAHRLASVEYPIEKYAITFTLDVSRFDGIDGERCVCLPISERMLSNIRTAGELARTNSSSCAKIVENCVFEIAIMLLKEMGITEKSAKPSLMAAEKGDDERVELAKIFIADNIESPLQVSEVAEYCYVSKKQLTRLFYACENLSLGTYIRRERIRHAELLLRTTDLTVGEISRKMNFPNESGFSAHFKKNNGMPPGEYRRMFKA